MSAHDYAVMFAAVAIFLFIAIVFYELALRKANSRATRWEQHTRQAITDAKAAVNAGYKLAAVVRAERIEWDFPD